MAGDPITTGLILSSVASTAGAVQGIGVAQSTAKQRKRQQELAIASDRAEAADAEQQRQERLRQALSRQQASFAAAGVSGSSQSAIASANSAVSTANRATVRQRTSGAQFRPQRGLGAVNRQVFNALGTVGKQVGDLPPGGSSGGSIGGGQQS